MQDLAAYLDFVDHPAISGMYDTFHANIEEADPIAAIGASRTAHDPRPHLRERPRRAGRGHVPWKETFRAHQEIRLRRLADDRSFRPRPARARRRDARLAGFFGRPGGGLSRGISRRSRRGGRRRERATFPSGAGGSMPDETPVAAVVVQHRALLALSGDSFAADAPLAIAPRSASAIVRPHLLDRKVRAEEAAVGAEERHRLAARSRRCAPDRCDE